MLKKKVIVLFCIVVGVIVLFFGIFYNRVYRSVGDAESVVEFEIKPGDSIVDVGAGLSKADLIASKYYWLFYAWKNDLRGKVKAGTYSIDSSYAIPEIALIVIGVDMGVEKEQKSVTFPEGWDVNKVKARLESSGLDVSDFYSLVNDPDYFYEKYDYAFLADIPSGQSLEGYLFPDTYFFYVDASSEEIIVRMLDNFNNKLSSEMIANINSQGRSIHEMIAMASIIEREVKSEKDMLVVGGIFWNRIEVGQPLQSCATLAYILGENKDQYTYEDTRVESDYNTYLNAGLPPGPIANPGLSSIMAAIYPEDTSYNYFLTSPKTGETIFSVTLDEHNLNKAKVGL
ncbi:endolytic transglycosylase MltG [Patescibacteria group bacterium]